MTKTYAVKGLIDWQMALNIGGATIKICFSGGRMGSNGVLPAKYTTDSPAIQDMIEKTDYFRQKRIFIYDYRP
ncbi:MAG: hypothetical protein J1E95_08170 [Muribaculaceae bacterium]|nr:hypothetical protein [Muribaculaceae bacterium]